MMPASLPLLLLLWMSTPPGPAASSSSSEYLRYHNYSAMAELLARVGDTAPHLASLYSVGKSVLGKDLWVMKLTTAPEEDIGVPYVKLVAGIHGNEAVGKELLLQLIQFLAESCRSDETVAWLLRNTRIHVMPSMNPDGAELDRSGLSCKTERGRLNLRSFDLDKNFPDHFRPVRLFPQPESDAMIAWLERHPFSLAVNLHGGDLVVSYPFENTPEEVTGHLDEPSPSPDDDVFRHLATVYAASHRDAGQGCLGGRVYDGGISNAAARGHVTGGMQDYSYVTHGCMEVTAHVSCCVQPPEEDLPGYWRDNKHALLNFLYEAHRGVKGIVVDHVTNEPVSGALVWVDNRIIPFHTSAKGEFWKILLPGRYHLRVSKSGYDNLTVPFTVSPPAGRTSPRTTWMRLALLPEGRAPSTAEVATSSPAAAWTGTTRGSSSPATAAARQPSSTDRVSVALLLLKSGATASTSSSRVRAAVPAWTTIAALLLPAVTVTGTFFLCREQTFPGGYT